MRALRYALHGFDARGARRVHDRADRRRAAGRAAEGRRRPRACRAIYLPASFADLPGWTRRSRRLAWPRSKSAASASRRAPRPALPSRKRAHRASPPQSIWQRVCDAAAALPASTPLARARSSKRILAVPRIDRRGRQRRRARHRLLRAAARRESRTPSAQFAMPLYAPPDDLLVVDLASLYPELKDKRVRGRVEGRRVVPYWTRADIERGHARRRAARRSSTSTIRSTRSSCRSRARAASRSTTAA